jgi:tRNA nucleotidyltransferase (CCA-adding enzyme)
LKFDNDTIDKVTKIVRYHDQAIEPSDRSVRRAVNRMGEDIFPMILQVRRADVSAQSAYKKEEKLQRLIYIEDIYRGICSRGEAVSLKSLEVTGSDLIALGMQPGRQIGEMLRELLELVLDDPALNQKEKLLGICKEKM